MKMKYSYRAFYPLLALILVAGLTKCSDGGKNGPLTAEASAFNSDPMKNKGIGPVTNLILSAAVDNAMAVEGKKIYDAKCTACHNPTQKLIGPPQKDVLSRRTPEWIMNMMLNPQEMIAKDPIAKQVLKECNNVPMTDQGLTQDEARKILEYIRTI